MALYKSRIIIIIFSYLKYNRLAIIIIIITTTTPFYSWKIPKVCPKSDMK